MSNDINMNYCKWCDEVFPAVHGEFCCAECKDKYELECGPVVDGDELPQPTDEEPWYADIYSYP